MSARKSTIGRATLVTARAAARVVERVAPALGARHVVDVWFRVPVPPPHRGPQPLVDAGAPVTLDVGGTTVRGNAWGDGPTVVLVHGWGGWGTQLVPLVRPLVEAGFRVVTYDAPSHGTSGPGMLGRGRATLLDMSRALAAVVDEHGPVTAVVAHSLGAAATALSLRGGTWTGGRPAVKVDRLVFVAPPTNPGPHLAMLARFLGYGRRVTARLEGELTRRTGVTIAETDMPGIARDVATPPVLVVHDRDDREVPVEQGIEIARAWPESTLVTTTGLGHRRVLRDQVVIDSIVSSVAGR